MGSKRIICFVLALALPALIVPASAALAGPVLSDEHPSTTWYLAEGSTGEGEVGYFETFVLVANPTASPAVVGLSHQLETLNPATAGDWPGITFSLPANSRMTVNVADSIAAGTPGSSGHVWSVSTRVESDRQVVAERAVYWTSNSVKSSGGITRQAATDCIGVTAPGTSWYLSEGSTHSDADGYFETWVLVQNPGDVDAEVQVIYQTVTGNVPGPTFTLGKHTRKSISIADVLPGTDSVSTQVNASSPVVVERAMYWSNPTCSRIAAHDSIGATTTSFTHYMPMASVSTQDVGHSRYETYILVQNPNATPTRVDLSFMPQEGGPHAGPVIGPSQVVPAHSRYTFDLSGYKDAIGTDWFGVLTLSDLKITAEKSMYLSYIDPYGTWSVRRAAAFGSNSLDDAWTVWDLAEGSTGQYPTGAFRTWIAVMNPGGAVAHVTVGYDTPGGTIPGPTVDIGAYSLRVINVGDTLPNAASVSTRLNCFQPVAAERFMTWTADGFLPPGIEVGLWAGTTSIGVPFLPI